MSTESSWEQQYRQAHRRCIRDLAMLRHLVDETEQKLRQLYVELLEHKLDGDGDG